MVGNDISRYCISDNLQFAANIKPGWYINQTRQYTAGQIQHPGGHVRFWCNNHVLIMSQVQVQSAACNPSFSCPLSQKNIKKCTYNLLEGAL